jgi:hypothetical protein
MVNPIPKTITGDTAVKTFVTGLWCELLEAPRMLVSLFIKIPPIRATFAFINLNQGLCLLIMMIHHGGLLALGRNDRPAGAMLTLLFV